MTLPVPLSDEDEELALSLAVVMAAAGNPAQYDNIGDHARAIIRELRRLPLAALHLPDTQVDVHTDIERGP